MNVITEADFELIVKMVESISCEHRSGCDLPAAWSVICIQCRAVLLMCDPHVQRKLRGIDLGRTIRCTACNAPSRRGALVVELVPIGGKVLERLARLS